MCGKKVKILDEIVLELLENDGMIMTDNKKHQFSVEAKKTLTAVDLKLKAFVYNLSRAVRLCKQIHDNSFDQKEGDIIMTGM